MYEENLTRASPLTLARSPLPSGEVNHGTVKVDTSAWWRAGKQLPRLVRAIEWWDYKLAVSISFFYATAFILQVPIVSLWPSLVAAFLALVACGAFANIINDVTDREDDLAAGKPNRLTGKLPEVLLALAAGPVLVGLIFAFLWQANWLLLSAYLTMWLAFVLYSVPPFRWKTRGLLGVFACAAGDSFFPTLVAVLSAFQAARRPPDGWSPLPSLAACSGASRHSGTVNNPKPTV